MKEFKPFRLDAVEHRLLRMTEDGQGVPIAMTAKTFDVLRYFVEHPGRLITHEELLETLWADVAVQPEVLKGHVLAIRTALEDDAQRPRFLETHRGRGYRFIAPVENLHLKQMDAVRPQAPLIGRETPWAQLHACFDHAAHGKTCVVLIRGDAGIGKTALAEAFCKDLGRRHASITFGRCIEGFAGVEPFYPVIEALARWIKSEESGRVQDALLSHAPSWGGLLGGLLSRERRTLLLRSQNIAAKGRVLGEFCDLLEFLAESGPIVLWLEDIHWADFSTLDLLSALARRQSESPILVIGTVRTDDSLERAAALKQLIGNLQLHGLCHVIDLKGLKTQDVAHFLGSHASPSNAELATYLHQRTGGNPLFLSILLDHLRRTGVAGGADGAWTLSDAAWRTAGDIPPTIGELVESRIARIDDESRRVLEAAAAVGESFSAVISASAAGLSIRRCEEICEALCRSGAFITRQQTGVTPSGESFHVYAFRHALYREVLLARQGPLRLAQSHALIAKELEKSPAPEGDEHSSFALAEQFTQAREWTKAVAYLRMALQTAKRRFAHQDALAILDKVDRVASNMSGDAQAAVQLELMEDRASIYAASHDQRALEVFTRLSEMAGQCGRTDVQARAELGCAFAWSWVDTSHCAGHLMRAFELAEGQPTPQLRARIRLSSTAWRIWIAGWTSELSQHCEANLRPLRNGSDRQITAWGLIEYSMICLVSSRYREAIETIDENLDILMRHAIDRPEFNVFRAIWMSHLGRPWAYVMLGEWGRALSEFEASETLFVANANRYSICTLETLRGFLHLMAGDHATVRDICLRLGCAPNRAQQASHPLYSLVLANEIRHGTLLAGAAEVGLGNVQAGIDMLAALEQEMRERPVIMDWYWRFLLLWVLANAQLDMGRVEQASLYATDMARAARQTEEGTWQALALALQARIALFENKLDAAVDAIENAVQAVETFGAPLAEWRVHKLASQIHRKQGDADAANASERRFGLAAKRLLDSLPAGHSLGEALSRTLHDV
jgi:DNA-binding winged helix-turn-helix (wHTH) protein/tetratricopeptide (TPR) repeat protein